MERIFFKIGLVWCGLVLMVFLGSSLFYYSYYSTKKSVKVVTMPVVETKAATIANEIAENKIMTEEVEADARPLLIKRYLEKYNSPLAPYYQLIFDLSETYGFEYYWIPAIGQQESNLCKKIPEGSHNCWGYGIHKNGTLKFDSYELALKSYAEYLKRVYFDKGLNTPELIMKKYCPHSDGSWARGVNQFINTIESGNF
ncbi:MAG TPA: hypothetical protein PK639_02720 [Candidatus Woesebacteria bacterium]|nr:hypothetical protein [Candidatus Woesebacteria bacterium]